MKKVLPKIGLSAIENQRFIDILSVDEYQLFQLLTHTSFLNYFSSFFSESDLACAFWASCRSVYGYAWGAENWRHLCWVGVDCRYSFTKGFNCMEMAIRLMWIHRMVATEVTEFVRNQILSQSATAIFSQANSLTQMLAGLLEG
ncbi:MAG: hypothetical protein IJD16_06355 [Desulfovibrio sp.]|nr:hypothetical protein [Desulfovibrio sp.]